MDDIMSLPLCMDKRNLFIENDLLKAKEEKIEQFIENEKNMMSLEFAKKVLSSNEVQSNNMVEGYCDDIEKMSYKFGAKVFNAKELYNAVNLIDKMMEKDDVALLSPACASLDQFSSYAHRGDKFKEFIAKII